MKNSVLIIKEEKYEETLLYNYIKGECLVYDPEHIENMKNKRIYEFDRYIVRYDNDNCIVITDKVGYDSYDGKTVDYMESYDSAASIFDLYGLYLDDEPEERWNENHERELLEEIRYMIKQVKKEEYKDRMNKTNESNNELKTK